MKRIGIIVALGLFLGFAPALHAVSTCSPNIPESTPAADFTDHGDGTVTHSRTGLMWKRCAEGQSWIGGTCTGIASTATWANALIMGRNATMAGHSDWRLPNVKELQSIAEEQCYSSSINEAIFPSTPASYFWSASAYANYSSYAWYVNFSDGVAYYSVKGSAYQVRLVRAGQSFGSFDSSKNGIVLSTTPLNFAAQNLGTTSAAQTVTLTNNGGTPLNIASIVASGDYAVAHNCGAGLGAGGFCTLNITFTPTATGTRTGAVTITDDSVFSTKTISLTGIGQGAAVSLSTTALYFASQNQDSTSAAQTITLTNPGGALLNIASIVASGDFARTTTCGATLAQAANCTISVTFTPTAAGARSGSIVITSNAASSPNTISLSGTGLAVPVVSLNPTSLTFAAQAVGTSSAPKTIALTNTGGAALTLTSIAASGDFAVTHNCGGGLGAGGFCNLSVTFTPTLTGSRTGAITITSNAAGSPRSVSLSGVGKLNQTIGPITFTPSTLAVGGTTTASAVATSGLAVSFSTTSPACTATGVNGKTITGITTGACIITVSQTGNATYNAAPQATQTIVVAKRGQTIGPITFTPSTLAVGGTSTASAVATSGLPVTFSTASSACTVTGSTIRGITIGTCSITANQAGNASYNAAPLRAQTIAVGAAAPAVSLNRTALIFAARRPGTTSPAQAVTLTNTGAAVLNITGIVASGDFARTTTCAATLAAGASCTINVTFTATAMGARAGLVTLTSNAAGSPHRITLTGTGKGTRYDFNGDGKSDILWRNTTTGANQIWFMNGGLKSSFANTTAAAAPWAIAGVDDFNGDGKADLLWRHPTIRQTVIWLMNGITRLSSTTISPAVVAPWAAAWNIAGTGDFNGDGKADILWRSNLTTGLTAGANQIWLMNGAARTSAANTTAAASALAVAGVADFNGDGKTDILWRNAATGQDTVWLMNGAAAIAGSGATGTLAAPWTIAGTGDFNGDGKADILWRNTTNGLDSIWFMNGKAAAGATTNAAATVWSVAGVADFNGDGKADITWRYPATGATQLWLMNGAARSSAANLTPLMLPPWSVAK